MISTPESREKLLKELVSIPSITGSTGENRAADFVCERLSELRYFRENPGHLARVPAALPGESRELHTIAARMMARIATKKTVVFVAHYDVVDVGVYGDLRDFAFDADELAARLDPDEFGGQTASDIRSGGFIFGRGVMDMKCGLALEMELLRDYDHDRSLFDVNVIVLVVPDEENTGGGMRGAARYLAELKKNEGLEYIAGIDTEPSEPGLPDAENQLIFMGTMGKLLPFFYCRGVEAHVGNYYRGVSAALMSSHVVVAAEGAGELADPCDGDCQPSWICLEQRILAEGYSVTVPSRSIVYFNCFATKKSPADVLGEMCAVAKRAADETTGQVAKSHEAVSRMGYKPGIRAFDIRVLTFGELFDRAAAVCKGGADALASIVSQIAHGNTVPDLRDRGIGIVEELIRISSIEPPFIAVGFLPPFNPQKTSLDGAPRSGVVVRAAARVIDEAREKFGVRIDRAGFFAGLSDMSFMGWSGTREDADAFTRNCPGGNALLDIPFDLMREIDMPIVNLGPCGYDAHKKSERLERRYSLETLPHLLVYLVNAISEEWDLAKP